MKNLISKKSLKISAVVAVVAAVLAPNGFFTGHRTVTLEGKVEPSIAETYLPADNIIQKSTVIGTVTTSTGMPISGAMISAFNENRTRKITAYSNPDGTYELPLTYAGNLQLRVRTPYFEDAYQDVVLENGATVTADFVHEKFETPMDLSNSLTASAHIAKVEWPTDADRSTFISQCNFCHQIGNSLTRRPRSKEEWNAVVERMEGYLVLITDDERDTIVETLNDTFTGQPIEAIQTWDVSPELPKALVEEWVAGDGLSFIHDADIASDGHFYGADEGHDIVWKLDRETGEIKSFKMPDIDLPVGGKFSGFNLHIGVFTGKHGPHSFAEGDDGRIWLTNSLSSQLMAFDLESNEFESFDIGADSLYLHTIRKDLDGNLWFTAAASNQVGKFNPKTKQLDLLDLPSNGVSRWLADAFMPTLVEIGSYFPRKNLPVTLSHSKTADEGRHILNMPYGIDVNPVDGSTWYVKLYANKVGRIDPVTLEITEWDTPAIGPRRPRFDKEGTLWIPGFDSGELVSLNTKTMEFTHYPVPKLSPNEYETPYALNINPETGLVWITSNMSDRIFSFDPKTEEFVSYPLPTRVSYLRDIVFTKDGKVCSSNSNLPSYAIEGGLGGFICLIPDKNK